MRPGPARDRLGTVYQCRVFQSRRHRDPLRQVKTPLAQLVKLGAVPDVPVRLVPDDLEDITIQASILRLLKKNLIITRGYTRS